MAGTEHSRRSGDLVSEFGQIADPSPTPAGHPGVVPEHHGINGQIPWITLAGTVVLALTVFWQAYPYGHKAWVANAGATPTNSFTLPGPFPPASPSLFRSDLLDLATPGEGLYTPTSRMEVIPDQPLPAAPARQ